MQPHRPIQDDEGEEEEEVKLYTDPALNPFARDVSE